MWGGIGSLPPCQVTVGLAVTVAAPASHPSFHSDLSGFQQQLWSLIPSGLGVGRAPLFLARGHCTDLADVPKCCLCLCTYSLD